MKTYQTKFGEVTLSQIGENTYEVYDAFDDTYRGTIQIDPWNITEASVNQCLNDLWENKH